MLNYTRIPAPRVTIVDPQTGIVSNEWFRFFNNLYTIAYAATGSVTPGTYGSATAVPQITVDDFGTITGISNVPIAIDASQIVSGTIASARISGSYTGITGVGTLTVGTWNASAITTPYGGTGLSSYTAGDTLYYASGSALTKLAIGASTYINTSSGTAPQWTDPTTITIGKATNLVGGAANRIAYQTAADTTGFIVAPTVSNTYLEWSGTAFQWSSNPLGTVTSVSVVSANGLAGTVATATTTPAITLSTTVTGLLKGNGTAISAASSGTDYAPATSGTSILYGNGAGGFSNVTIGTGVSFAAGTLSATGSGGTVTSVAALTLGTTGTDLSSTVANGTTTPVITLNVPTASAANRGALSAADWTTFNSKAPGVTFTTNYIPYGQGTTTLNQSAELQYSAGALSVSTSAGASVEGVFTNTNTGASASAGVRGIGNSTGYYLLRQYGTGVTATVFGITLANYALLASDGASSNGLMVGSLTSDPVIFGTNNTERMRIASTGNVLLSGISTARAVAGITPLLQLESTTTNVQNSSISLISNSGTANTNASVLSFGRAATSAIGSVVGGSAGLSLGKISFAAGDGTSLIASSLIEAQQDAVASTGIVPGRILFSTANSSGTMTERMRIDSAGNTYVETGTLWQYAPAPTSKAAAATLTAAEVQTGILNTTGTTYTITLPTGTALDTAFAGVPTTNIGFDWFVVNSASGIITIAVGATGMTSVGTLTIATGVSAQFRLRRTAANTYVLYRLG